MILWQKSKHVLVKGSKIFLKGSIQILFVIKYFKSQVSINIE